MADPFTPLGISVNLIQIVALAVALGRQIWKFTDERATLPQNLETIKQRLDIMAATLKDLDTSDYSEEAAQSLELYLASMDKKLTRFQKMLDE